MYICGWRWTLINFFIFHPGNLKSDGDYFCESKSFREQVENLCLLFRFLQKKTAWRDCPHIFKDFTQRHYEVLEKNYIFS